MDRLDAMAVFVAVADAGSLSAAARRLATPLTTVSRRLAALEAHLGVTLLQRTTRSLTLTDLGRRYLESARRVLAEVDEAERLAAGEQLEPRGLLQLTAPVAFGRIHVLPIVTELLNRFPKVDVRLMLVDRVVGLVEEGIELAVRIGDLPDSTATAIRVGSIRRIVCVSPGYLARHGTPATPDALGGHACVTFGSPMGVTRWVFPTETGERTVTVRSRLTVNTAEAAVQAAASGLGPTQVLSYQAAAAITSGTLVEVLAPFASAQRPVSLVYPAGRYLPSRVRAFIELAAPRLRRALAISAAAPA